MAEQNYFECVARIATFSVDKFFFLYLRQQQLQQYWLYKQATTTNKTNKKKSSVFKIFTARKAFKSNNNQTKDNFLDSIKRVKKKRKNCG